MKHLSKSGNWVYNVRAGVFGWADPWICREIVPPIMFDVEGLPERWVEILLGKTNWIPKIVFKIEAEKIKRKKLFLRDRFSEQVACGWP